MKGTGRWVTASHREIPHTKGMPRKERPAPLSDAIFRAKLDQQKAQNRDNKDGVPAVPEEIPVHNTFIQFGSPEGLDLEKQHLSTAPAWIGPSFQSMIQSVMQPMQPNVQEWSSLTSPKKLASPKKVPVMRYSLSASSARAAGVPTSNAVVASYEPCGGWPDSVASGADEDDDGAETVDGDAATKLPLGELPSVGSAKHAEGLCKRCCFFPKGRCLNGTDCEFCHFDHEKRKRKKKKKKGSKQKDSDSDGDDSGATDDPDGSGEETANHFEVPMTASSLPDGWTSLSQVWAAHNSSCAGEPSISAPPLEAPQPGASVSAPCGGLCAWNLPGQPSVPVTAPPALPPMLPPQGPGQPLTPPPQAGPQLEAILGPSQAPATPSGQPPALAEYEVDPYYGYSHALPPQPPQHRLDGYNMFPGAYSCSSGSPLVPGSTGVRMQGYDTSGLPPQGASAGSIAAVPCVVPGYAGRPAPR